MNGQTSLISTALFSSIMLVLAACGGEQIATPPPAPGTSEPTSPPPAAPPATAEPAAGVGSAAAGAGGGAGDEQPAAHHSAGRPAILMGPSKEIASTFGSSPGASLKLKGDKGTITLRLPEFSLRTGTNIRWKIEAGRAGKSKGPVIGSIASIETTIGGRKRPGVIKTDGPPFEVQWPTGDKDTINLAIGVRELDSVGNPGKVKTWTIVAPKSVDKSFKEAHFYLSEIGPAAYLHATTAAASAGGDKTPADK